MVLKVSFTFAWSPTLHWYALTLTLYCLAILSATSWASFAPMRRLSQSCRRQTTQGGDRLLKMMATEAPAWAHASEKAAPMPRLPLFSQ